MEEPKQATDFERSKNQIEEQLIEVCKAYNINRKVTLTGQQGISPEHIGTVTPNILSLECTFGNWKLAVEDSERGSLAYWIERMKK